MEHVNFSIDIFDWLELPSFAMIIRQKYHNSTEPLTKMWEDVPFSNVNLVIIIEAVSVNMYEKMFDGQHM